MRTPKILFIILASVLVPFNMSAHAGVLTDCDKSDKFNKRLEKTVKKLEGRLKKYEKGTPPALALQQQIQQTKDRFQRYKDSNLLCGQDGLPHLVVSGDWNHAAEFMLPGMMFLYITGWIGWAGRTYLQQASKTSNPPNEEIIINVPVALKIMATGYMWPVLSWREFLTGKFIASKDEITVSPR
jgi:photosystem I subunit 3